MLIVKQDQGGNVEIEQVADLPSDYTCSEWQAYSDACDKAPRGASWTDEQAQTYAAYHQAMSERAGK